MVALISRGTIAHVAVRMLEKNPGEDYVDARGPFPAEKFDITFRTPKPYTLREVTEKELEKESEGTGQYIHKSDIVWAEQIAQMLWPDLPWKNGPRERARAFAEELEVLSLKYNLWVCSPYPTTEPFLTSGDGDTKGYVLTPDALGKNYKINRRI